MEKNEQLFLFKKIKLFIYIYNKFEIIIIISRSTMILDHSVRSEIIIRIVACDNYDGFSTTQLHSFMKVHYTIF
jgi:hypothetical protein